MKSKQAITAFLIVCLTLSSFVYYLPNAKAATGTFGFSNIGDSQTWQGAADGVYCHLTQDCVVTALHAYIGDSGSGNMLRFAIYDSAGHLVYGDDVGVAIGFNSWNNKTGLNVPLSAGYYWLFEQGFSSGGGGGAFLQYNENEGASNYWFSLASSSSWVSVLAGHGGTFSGYNFSIYANYTYNSGSISVSLNGPSNNSVTSVFAQNFTFTPVLVGADKFFNASLYVDNVWVAGNGSALVNNTVNGINYNFTRNGIYVWSVEVWDSTNGVFSDGNFSLTVAAQFPVSVVVDSPLNATLSSETLIVNLVGYTNGSGLQMWYCLYNSSGLMIGNTSYLGLATVGNLVSDNYRLVAYVNNSEGFSNSTTINFSIELASDTAAGYFAVGLVVSIGVCVAFGVMFSRRKNE